MRQYVNPIHLVTTTDGKCPEGFVEVEILPGPMLTRRDDARELRLLLKAVQSDPGNWLHSDLLDKIEAVVGEAAPYRSLEDSGLAPTG